MAMRKYIIIAVALLMPTLLHAQSAIWEDPVMGSEYSIIRHYKGEKEITYDALYMNKGFSLVDRSTNTKYYFPVPDSISVDDFRILDDTVWLCGATSSGAMVGCFDIASVFSPSGGSLDFCVLSGDYIQCQSVWFHDELQYFSRLQVKRIDRTLHLFLIGWEASDSKDRQTYNSMVADLWRDASGAWKFHYIVDRDKLFQHDDLAVTENYLVVTSTGGIGHPQLNSHNITAFVLPDTYQALSGLGLLDCQPTLSLIPSQIIMVSYQYTDLSLVNILNLNARVVAMEGDKVVTVCYGDADGIPSQTVISVYTDPTINPYIRCYFNSGAITHIRELAYNQHMGRLLISPHCMDRLYWSDYPFANVTSDNFSDGENWFSVDYGGVKGDGVVSGSSYGYLNHYVWLHDATSPGSCYYQESIPTVEMLEDQIEDDFIQCVKTLSVVWHNIDVGTKGHELQIICTP